MAIEAELKALARDPERIHAALSRRAVGEYSIYSDRYFDYPDRGWTRQDIELRVRTITDNLGQTRTVLTFKEPAVDKASGSKPEHETAIGDADVLVTVLTALGLEPIVAFEKRCVNYRFIAQGRDLLATVVTIPELSGQTFIELETIADPDDVDAALSLVRSVLRELEGLGGVAVNLESTLVGAARRPVAGKMGVGGRLGRRRLFVVLRVREST